MLSYFNFADDILFPAHILCLKRLEYQTDLFDADTIERIAERFQLLLERAIDDPAQNISVLALVTESEKRRLLVDWNNTGRDYPRHLCIQQLFEAQVEQTPEAPAVVFQNQS